MAGMVWISQVHQRDEAQAMRHDRWLRWAFPLVYVLAAGAVVVSAM
jgi:hypothetical protein